MPESQGPTVLPTTSSAAAARGTWPLQLLNFFMADMQAGIGPFLGIFLLAHHWQSGLIGTVMTAGGVAGMLVTAPAGDLIDNTSHKRGYVITSGVFTVLASTLLLVSQNFWVVCASQVATAIAGAAIGPAVAGITLGLVRQAGFPRQNGRNQAFNHAGNVVGAGLSGLLGWKFGLPAIVWLAAIFGALSIVSVWLIPADAIDNRAARGMKEGGDPAEKASGLKPGHWRLDCPIDRLSGDVHDSWVLLTSVHRAVDRIFRHPEASLRARLRPLSFRK